MPMTVAPASARARANCRWLAGKNGSTKTTFMPGMVTGTGRPATPGGAAGPARLARSVGVEELVVLAVVGPGVDGRAGPRAVAADVDVQAAGHAPDPVGVEAAGAQARPPLLLLLAGARQLVQLGPGHAVGGQAHAAVDIDDLVGVGPADRAERPLLVGAPVGPPVDDRRARLGRAARDVELQVERVVRGDVSGERAAGRGGPGQDGAADQGRRGRRGHGGGEPGGP